MKIQEEIAEARKSAMGNIGRARKYYFYIFVIHLELRHLTLETHNNSMAACLYRLICAIHSGIMTLTSCISGSPPIKALL